MSSGERVLILSVKAGAGHIRAAQAVELAFREHYPDVETLHADMLEYTNPAFQKAFSEGYEMLARDLPSVWGAIYQSMEEQPPSSAMKKLSTLFDRLNARPLREFVDSYQPDHVICTHYVPAEVLGPRRLKGKMAATLYTALTDYDIHSMWIQNGVDHYFVATDEMAFALKTKGIGKARVHVTGIPILPVFAQEYPDRSVMREKLGLKADLPTVLVSAGGFGLMSADQVVGILAKEIPNVQILAVAGKSRNLQKQLAELGEHFKKRVVAFGFVDNMHELMAASDFAVAKSGGLTTSECLAMVLPLVIFKPIPGQEERNATYLLEHGAALWAHTAAHMIYKAGQLLRDPARLAQMQEAARAIARPRAAQSIADIVMGRRS